MYKVLITIDWWLLSQSKLFSVMRFLTFSSFVGLIITGEPFLFFFVYIFCLIWRSLQRCCTLLKKSCHTGKACSKIWWAGRPETAVMMNSLIIIFKMSLVILVYFFGWYWFVETLFIVRTHSIFVISSQHRHFVHMPCCFVLLKFNLLWITDFS